MINNKEMNFISAVVYVRNNENEIKQFCDTVFEVLDSNFKKYEIIFVNDNSNDRSVELIKSWVSSNHTGAASLVNLSISQGVELAMNAGTDLAIGDFVFEFDSVLLDYSSECVMDVYKKSLEGYDIVAASPKNKTKLSSRLFYALFNKFSKARYGIKTDRFRIVSRRAINRVNMLSNDINYRKASYANSGLKVEHIMYKADLKAKRLKQDFSERNTTAVDSFIIFTDIAGHFAMILTSLLLLTAVGIGVFALVQYFTRASVVEGWTTTMLVLSGGFGGVFLVLSIIIKYLSILMNLILKKQKYLIEGVEKLK